MASEAQKRASARYDAGNTTSVRLKLNINTDVDIIEHLEKVKNKNGYLKELIRKDIERKQPTRKEEKHLGIWKRDEKGILRCSNCGYPVTEWKPACVNCFEFKEAEPK